MFSSLSFSSLSSPICDSHEKRERERERERVAISTAGADLKSYTKLIRQEEVSSQRLPRGRSFFSPVIGPMRVVPLNHCQLLVVDKDHPFIQLDSIKNQVSRGCASFSCFSCGGASAGLETTTTTTTPTPCPLKVEPLQHPVVSSTPPPPPPPPESVAVAVPENGKDEDANKADDGDTRKEGDTSKEAFKLSLRSSLKRPPSVVEPRSLEGIKEDETLSVDDDANDLTGGEDMGKRKVQWTDACGSELTQVREFEPSEMGLSDEEWETGRERSCSCVIM